MQLYPQDDFKKYGILNWRARKRPALIEEHAAARLAQCLLRKDWGVEEWIKYMWSNKCSVERGNRASQTWVFCTPAQKWNKEMIESYKKGKDISIIVQGCFQGSGRTDLYILDCDFKSKKHGYLANSYIEVLDAELARHYQPSLIFIQDNALIHTAYKVRDWFKEQRIPCVDQPPCSPDLNPIEHVWKVLKRTVLDLHLKLKDIQGEENICKALGTALQEAWSLIPKEFFNRLIESIEARVKAVIEAKGWHTKYQIIIKVYYYCSYIMFKY